MNAGSFLKKGKALTLISLLMLLALATPLNTYAGPLNYQPLAKPNFDGTQNGYHNIIQQQYNLSENPVLPDLLFKNKWQRADKPIADGVANPPRSWLWGPQSFSPSTGTTEPYSESPGGNRTVLYYDKARMELNNPASELVTNGLLVRELISGQLAMGDTAFVQRHPAWDIPMAGDFNNNSGPTYFSFARVASTNNDNPAPDHTGKPVIDTITRDGVVGANPDYSYFTKYAYYESTLKHNIPGVFWDFLNQRGNVYVNGQLVDNQPVLGDNPAAPWLDATGYPLTEAYWATVLLGNKPKLVLIQAYERRVLTFTPDNPVGFKVEMGNVGRHYYAWRYDPKYDATNMAVDRSYHTATLLPNGKVLVTGGLGTEIITNEGKPSSLTMVELYDPVTGTWSFTGSITTPRSWHTATLLANGKVLVVGGYIEGIIKTNSAELYDPTTGVWTPTSDLNTARGGHTATLLFDGKVLVTGGSGSDEFGSPELYDPNTGSWTPTGNMLAATPQGYDYDGHSATLLLDGKVLVVYRNTAQLYDPATGTWAATGKPISFHLKHSATLLPTGRVLVADRVGEASPVSAELYDPVSGTWSETGNMSTPTSEHTATLLTSGKVLVTGGRDTSSKIGLVPNVELYDPATGTWGATGAMLKDRWGHTATLLKDGKVLVTGGPFKGIPPIAELYDPATGKWSLTGVMNKGRILYTATLLQNGKVLVAGGYGEKSAELYDPATGTWSFTGSLSTEKYLYEAILLKDGKVLVAGGAGKSAELYDPATGSWSVTGSLNNSYSDPTATLLADGKVLITGGGQSKAEIYDPATGKWSVTGEMNTPRRRNTITLLLDGKVLVTGGRQQNDSGITTAEIYDPTSGKWSLTGNMTTSRADHTATLLTGGKVLVTGGYGGSTTSELYDPTTGNWSLTSPVTH